jgi:hypothetical protein
LIQNSGDVPKDCAKSHAESDETPRLPRTMPFQALQRNPQVRRELDLRETERDEKLFEKDLSGVTRNATVGITNHPL